MIKIHSAAVRATAALFLAVCPAVAAVCRAAVAPQDDYLRVEGFEEVSLGVKESLDTSYGAYFSVDSGSEATLSASGLPSGVKFDPKSFTFSGAPSKSGVFYVTLSAKNKNGFKQILTSKWTVGDAGDGDYDDIGIDWSALVDWNTEEEPVAWETGRDVYFSLYGVCTNGEVMDLAVSGLPTGLKKRTCPANADCFDPASFHGVLTKPGKFKLTITAKDWDRRQVGKAVKTIIVKDSGCRYVELVSSDTAGGTVGASKVYACGAKASISARAKPGYVFAGWYVDEDLDSPFYGTASGDHRKASDSFYVSPDGPERLYARFVPKSEDYVEIDADGVWNVDTSSCWTYLPVEVYSVSIATVTVGSLPAGVKWDKTGLMFYIDDMTKLKPGSKDVVVKAKNLSGNTDTFTIRVNVPNIQSYVFEGLDYSSDAYNITLGTSDGCIDGGWLGFGYDSDCKITASGLPPGLKLVAADGYAYVKGVATKAGTYTVTLTAKYGRQTEKATFTITVDPLPEIAIGTFNGVLRDEYGNVCGTFTFVSAANGKQSVKVVTDQGTASMSRSSWDCIGDGMLNAFFYKDSKNESIFFWLDLREDAAWNDAYQMSGDFSWFKSSAGGEMYVEASVDTAQRNPFGKSGNVYENPEAAAVAAELASQYKSKKMVIVRDGDRDAYKLECADCVYVPEWDNYGSATLSVDKNGTVKASGKLYGLYPFSASVPLVFDTANGDWIGGGEHGFAFLAPVVKEKVCTTCCGSEYHCATYSHIEPIYWFPAGD